MLKRKFDPKQPHRAVAYLRMSTENQNPRSPDQQLDEIQRRLKDRGYPWTIVKTYRDDGVSGRYTHKRPQYQMMMREIKSRAVVADLILVDTLDRLGRVDDLATIIKRLHDRHNVLVLTAISNFLDPTTSEGRALGLFDSLRASEENIAKAHMVVRGKRDSVLQKKWPGSCAPFGYRLHSVMRLIDGREDVEYHTLVPDPLTSWIIVALFNKARETGWGAVRLAKWLNAHPDIPAALKPFHFTTVGRWLDSPIYVGELLWNVHCTGIIDNVRVLEKNPDEDVVRVADFCEPLIPRGLWEEIQTLRRGRSAQIMLARRRCVDAVENTIAPLSRGVTVNYLLSGLVFCKCGLRMIASSTGIYTTKAGDERRYTSYVCPGHIHGVCDNNRRVPEAWLRTEVVARLRKRLFPDSE